MKAYRITWNKYERGCVLGLGYPFEMPKVNCLVCEPTGEGSGDSSFEYPALQFPFLNKREFNENRVVTRQEYDKIKQRIERAFGHRLNLVPGSVIGTPTGKAFRSKLPDIAWGSILFPQISKRAVELLANEGINLVTGECHIRYHGRDIDTHLALQIEPEAMLTEEGLRELGIEKCPECGDFKPPKPRFYIPSGEPKRNRFLIDAKAWPKGQHLVTMTETHRVLASPEFREAVKKHKLVDIKFEPCGTIK